MDHKCGGELQRVGMQYAETEVLEGVPWVGTGPDPPGDEVIDYPTPIIGTPRSESDAGRWSGLAWSATMPVTYGGPMSFTGLASFDRTVHLTNLWLKELAEEMHCQKDRQRAYHALRAVLHALRDRLPVGEAANLGAQLPLLLRGVYYEGWRPVSHAFHKPRNKAQFMERVASALSSEPGLDAEPVVRSVLRLLARHVSGGEINDVKRNLPESLQTLWN